MPDPATSLQPTWLATLPLWLQHRDKVPHYSGLRPSPRTGTLDTPEDRKRLVAFHDLRLGKGFEPGYALGPVADRVLCGVDLDKCFDSEGKIIEPLKMFCTVAREAGAMIEVSRSGHGLHVVWLALPEHTPSTFKRSCIESYTGGRFFAWGRRVLNEGAPTPIDMRPAFAHLPAPAPVERAASDKPRVQGEGRNNWLFEQALRLHQIGFEDDALRETLLVLNESLEEPLEERELEATIFKRIGKFIAPVIKPASEVFGVVEVTKAVANLPWLARPLGDSSDFDYDVVYHLIDNVLPLGGLTMLWGESTAGKSFLALDWCLHLVYGREWQGRKVRPSRVFYMAGEGEVGLMKRVVAWRKHHGIAEPTGHRFMVHNLKHVTAFEALTLDAYTMPECDLIVIDTLNRWSQGNENASDEMGAWLRVAQVLSDKAGGAAVLIVHHARKEGDQYRGSTAIKAAVDAEFEISGTRTSVTITHRKSKDEEMLDPITLMKRVVSLGEKDDGFGGVKMHTSLVFETPTSDEEKTVQANNEMENRIIEAMRKCGGEVSSRNGLLQLVKGMREPVLACIREMVARGTLIEEGRFGLRLKVFEAVEDDPIWG